MTELYINKQPVVLPENFSITIIEENPFFTKNGKYTYDITLSLLDPINARIYQHLNRINRKGDIPKNRSAYLVVDNEVVLNGTEVILEYTESAVKIQLVSGNSELNFLIGGDRKLRDLDLGKAYIYDDLNPEDRRRMIFRDMQLSYPERDWQLVPYCAGGDDIESFSNNAFIQVGNNYCLFSGDPGDGQQIFPYIFPFASGLVPQPYLCFIIKKALEYLGYTLVYNAIELHPVLKNLYIVHGIQTRYFSKMLPDWTVVEFFSKIEQWLNCQFIINPYDKSVKLMFDYQSEDESNGTVSINILDEYTTENENKNDKTVNNSNVAYSLDSEEYYKYMFLDANIKNKAIETNTWPLDELIIYNKNTEGAFQFILKPSDTSDRFISYLLDDKNPNKRTLKKVDSFRALYNNKESVEIDLELDIIPAAMKYTFIKVFGLSNYQLWLQIPIAGVYDPLLEPNNTEDPGASDPDTDPINIQSLIEDGSSSDKEVSYSKMRLAIYSGLQQIDPKSGETIPFIMRYPIAYVEALSEYFPETSIPRYFGQKEVNPFRLDYLKKEIYDKSQSIDTSKVYKFSYIDKGKIAVTAKFVANNRAFRCLKTERTVTNKGFDKIIKGEFYSYL